MKRRRLLLAAVALCAWAAGAAVAAAEESTAVESASRAPSSFYSRNGEGWFWYETPPPEKEETVEAPPPPEIPIAPPVFVKPSPTILPEIAAYEALTARLHTLQIIAVMNPTEENLTNFLRLQDAVVSRAATFADQWRRVVWLNPDLDYTNKHGGRPTGKAARFWDEDRRFETDETVAELARDHGLFYFFKTDDCPYCGYASTAVRLFADRHGMAIVPIAADGRPSPAWPNARLDGAAVAESIGIPAYPAVYLAKPGAETAAERFRPIAFGPISLDSLEERIVVITSSDAGERF